jgi:hypothetical protein
MMVSLSLTIILLGTIILVGTDVLSGWCHSKSSDMEPCIVTLRNC